MTTAFGLYRIANDIHWQVLVLTLSILTFSFVLHEVEENLDLSLSYVCFR